MHVAIQQLGFHKSTVLTGACHKHVVKLQVGRAARGPRGACRSPTGTFKPEKTKISRKVEVRMGT